MRESRVSSSSLLVVCQGYDVSTESATYCFLSYWSVQPYHPVIYEPCSRCFCQTCCQSDSCHGDDAHFFRIFSKAVKLRSTYCLSAYASSQSALIRFLNPILTTVA